MNKEEEKIQIVKDISPACNPPAAVAEACCGISKTKTSLSWFQMIILGILAGAFIGFGSELATMVSFDAAKYVGEGIAKFLFGSVFAVGLILVVIAGAELFTGNNLIVVGALNGNVAIGKLLNNWFWVYIANFVGSLLIVWLMYATALWKTGDFAVGAKALAIANAKVNLSWGAAFSRAILCNWLVCLAYTIQTNNKEPIKLAIKTQNQLFNSFPTVTLPFNVPITIKLFPVNNSAPAITTKISPTAKTLPNRNLIIPSPTYLVASKLTIVASSEPKPIKAPAKIPKIII